MSLNHEATNMGGSIQIRIHPHGTLLRGLQAFRWAKWSFMGKGSRVRKNATCTVGRVGYV